MLQVIGILTLTSIAVQNFEADCLLQPHLKCYLSLCYILRVVLVIQSCGPEMTIDYRL